MSATGTTDIDPCPYCGTTTGVQPTTGTSPQVQAWLCTACGTSWAVTVVNPQPYLDQLAASVELLGAVRSVLRAVIALSDELPQLTDVELRARLLALATVPTQRSGTR
ncbi:MAG: hypothetical protein ACRDRR_17015 [Pseudonocardiaceae bacterium]